MSYNYRGISNNPEERQRILYPYCFWDNAFTNDELDHICSLLSDTGLEEASIAALSESSTEILAPQPTILKETRRSKVAFHKINNQNQWIFERLNSIVEMMNNRWYNFDINGYDQIQYTEYHGKDLGFYDWHIDTFFGIPPVDSHYETRKLSVTLLLNDPEKDFEGGELQFGHELSYESANVKKGTLILFPSFNLHRVAPVTKGVRKSLVAWVLGPKFK